MITYGGLAKHEVFREALHVVKVPKSSESHFTAEERAKGLLT